MTVLENMLISPQNQIGESMFWGLLARPLWKIQEAKFVRRAKIILEFLEINHVINHLAEELSGGQQKLLAMMIIMVRRRINLKWILHRLLLVNWI